MIITLNAYTLKVDTIAELLKILDKIDINELGMRTRLEMEVDRFNKFQNMVFGEKQNNKKQKPAVDMRVYAKYVLKEGSATEKRELLANLRSRIVLKDKKLTLLDN